MARAKLIILSVSAVAIAATALAFVALSASGDADDLQQPFDSMSSMMEEGRMQMPASKDVIIMLESEYDMSAGSQSQVILKVLDKQTNEPVQGAEVIIGIEKGLPMTSMDMTGSGMFDASEKGNGTYAFMFTPESKGYYTVHAHVIPPGKQMHSMMENHADLVIMSR